MKSSDKSKKSQTVSVADFIEAGRAKLELELVGGKAGLSQVIEEASVNRPGLALTGFFQYFAHRRIQVLGHAEHAYLSSLDDTERATRIRGIFERHIPCVVVTRNRRPLPEVLAFGEEFGIPVLRCPMITGNFINAATLMMEDLRAPQTTMHGTMVEILGIGVLITGKAGIGKSETALELVRKGYSLVADDLTAIRMDSSGALMASSLDITRYHMELRGLGIIHVPSLFGVAAVRERKKLDMVVALERVSEENSAGSQDQDVGAMNILGVDVPRVTIPVAPGRNIAHVVEVAALDQKLKRLGHDAAKELDAKLIAVMSKGESGRE